MPSFLRPFAAVLAVCALSTVTAYAQQTPTPEQLELLNSLPAEQREALIEEYTRSGGRARG